VALTAGIGLIAPVMAIWNDSLSIWENVTTGNLTGNVLFTKVHAEDNTLPHGGGWGTISTGIDDEIDNGDVKTDHKITIFIDQVRNKANWTLNSKIENHGTIPIRFLTPTVCSDDALDVSYQLPDQVIEPGKKGLDPGDAVEGQIRIDLLTAEAGIYNFQIEVKCIQWNAFNDNLGWWIDTLHIYGTVVVEPPPE
jgi:hypothetical protein